MATIAPKTHWGVPLVLPHVLLSVGLLIFAAMSERAARPQAEWRTDAVREAGTIAVSVAANDLSPSARRL